MSAGISASAIAAGAAAVSAGAGAYTAIKGSGGGGGSTTSTQTSNVSPEMGNMLYGYYGSDGKWNNGLANNIWALSGQPQNSGLAQFGNDSNAYLGSGAGLGSLVNGINKANGMLTSNINAPMMNNASVTPAMMQAAQMSAASANAAQVNAPSQNGLNLSPTYQTMLSGASGNNPYLTGQIQKGIDQANDAYDNTMANTTRNLTQNVLPAINSGAVAAGGYGGSRQGIAQGNAIGQYGTALAQAGSQMGMNNQDAAANAQANTYMQGQSNALSALNNLSNQQYGTASQNANMQQQTNLFNAGNQQQAMLTNAQLLQQAGQVTSGYDQQAALTNAQLLQQTAQANQQSSLATNSLNSANALGAMGQVGNLTGQVYNYGNAQNAYPYWQQQQLTGMLQPLAGLGGSVSQTTPYYTNTAGNIAGAATAGLGLYNAYQKATGGGSPSGGSYNYTDPSYGVGSNSFGFIS